MAGPVNRPPLLTHSRGHYLAEAAAEAGLDREEDWNKRIDLVLSSGDSLLILEFMKPGVVVDFDHLNRFNLYVTTLRGKIQAQSAGRFRRVVGGYLVADRLATRQALQGLMSQVEPHGLKALDWATLLSNAEAQWQEFIQILSRRAPLDERLQAMALSVTADGQ